MLGNRYGACLFQVSALAIAFVLVCGCSTTWYHPEKDEMDFYADSSGCEAQAGQAAGPYDQYGIIRQRVYGNCTRGKGWMPE
jgi:hypothetical protein